MSDVKDNVKADADKADAPEPFNMTAALATLFALVKTIESELNSKFADFATNMTDEYANTLRQLFVNIDKASDKVESALSGSVKKFDDIVDTGTELGFFTEVERVTKKVTREGAGRKAMTPEEKLAAKILRAAK